MGSACECFLNRIVSADNKPFHLAEEASKFSFNANNKTIEQIKKGEIEKGQAIFTDTLLINNIHKSPGISAAVTKPTSPREVPNFEKQKKIQKDCIKIIICGAKSVGKTTFLQRISDNVFENKCMELFSFDNTIEVCNVTSNMNNYQFIEKNFNMVKEEDYAKCDCFFVFFDYSNEKSYIKAKKFIKNNLKGSGIPTFVIGNKCDLVNTENNFVRAMNTFCKKHTCFFHEISTKSNLGIAFLMHKLNSLFKKVQ